MGFLEIMERTRHRPVRSWLLMSSLAPPPEGHHLQLILDLEDAVPDDDKESARARLVELLAAGTVSAWVRVNSWGTRDWRRDLEAIRSLKGLAGVVLSKCESPRDVEDTVKLLGFSVPIIALIESSRGLDSVTSIAKSRGTAQLAFGPSDYCLDLGCVASDETLAYPRSRIVLASRVAGLAAPIDGPPVSADPTLVVQEARASYGFGFGGKLTLAVDQVSTIEGAFGPSDDEVRWAMQFLSGSANEPSNLRSGGYRPRLAQASRILADAGVVLS